MPGVYNYKNIIHVNIFYEARSHKVSCHNKIFKKQNCTNIAAQIDKIWSQSQVSIKKSSEKLSIKKSKSNYIIGFVST